MELLEVFITPERSLYINYTRSDTCWGNFVDRLQQLLVKTFPIGERCLVKGVFIGFPHHDTLTRKSALTRIRSAAKKT